MDLILSDACPCLGHLGDLMPIGPLVLAHQIFSAAMAMGWLHHDHLVWLNQLTPVPFMSGLATGLTRARLPRLRFLPRRIARRWLRRISRVAIQPGSKIEHLSLEVVDHLLLRLDDRYCFSQPLSQIIAFDLPISIPSCKGATFLPPVNAYSRPRLELCTKALVVAIRSYARSRRKKTLYMSLRLEFAEGVQRAGVDGGTDAAVESEGVQLALVHAVHRHAVRFGE